MKKNVLLISAVVGILSLNCLLAYWQFNRTERIHHAIALRIPKCCPTDANIEEAINQVVELFDLTEQKRYALYREYYVGGGEYLFQENDSTNNGFHEISEGGY